CSTASAIPSGTPGLSAFTGGLFTIITAISLSLVSRTKSGMEGSLFRLESFLRCKIRGGSTTVKFIEWPFSASNERRESANIVRSLHSAVFGRDLRSVSSVLISGIDFASSNVVRCPVSRFLRFFDLRSSANLRRFFVFAFRGEGLPLLTTNYQLLTTAIQYFHELSAPADAFTVMWFAIVRSSSAWFIGVQPWPFIGRPYSNDPPYAGLFVPRRKSSSRYTARFR